MILSKQKERTVVRHLGDHGVPGVKNDPVDPVGGDHGGEFHDIADLPGIPVAGPGIGHDLAQTGLIGNIFGHGQVHLLSLP
jgi:hypothetical protein